MSIVQPISARETIRCNPGWDYASPSAYFVTVYTQKHRYYDHILRGERDLDNLRLYISLNLEKWRQDEQLILTEAAFYG